MPSTSVQIWISSAPRAAPSSDADQSEPPRPSVVVTPSRVAPMKPGEDGHHAGVERGADTSAPRAAAVSSEERAGAAEGLVGDDHARGRRPPGRTGRGRARAAATISYDRRSPMPQIASSERGGQLAEVVDAGVEGPQLGHDVLDVGQRGGPAPRPAGPARGHRRAVALEGRRPPPARRTASRARASRAPATQGVGHARRRRRPRRRACRSSRARPRGPPAPGCARASRRRSRRTS